MSDDKDNIDKINGLIDNLDDLIGTVKNSDNIHDVIDKIKSKTDASNVNIDVEDKLGESVEYDTGVEIRQKVDVDDGSLGDIELKKSGKTIVVSVIDEPESYDYKLSDNDYEISRADADLNNGVLTVRIPKEDEKFEQENVRLGGENNGNNE